MKYQVVGLEDNGEHVAFTVVHETGLFGDGLMTKVATYTASKSLPFVANLLHDLHHVAGDVLEFYRSAPKTTEDLDTDPPLLDDDDDLVLG